MAHGDDFRAEVERLGWSEEEIEPQLAALRSDYRQAKLNELDRALCDFAVDLTRDPAAVDAARVEELATAGVDEVMLLDVVQVTSLFNYYNRLAEGAGVDPEPEWESEPG